MKNTLTTNLIRLSICLMLYLLIVYRGTNNSPTADRQIITTSDSQKYFLDDLIYSYDSLYLDSVEATSISK